MPRVNLLQLQCDWCENKETFDQNVPQSMALTKIHKWMQISRADDPVVQGMDNSRWYDSLSCLQKGEDRKQNQWEEQQTQNAIAAKVNRKPVLVPVDSALPPIATITGEDS